MCQIIRPHRKLLYASYGYSSYYMLQKYLFFCSNVNTYP
nr:MAG TPA: hypothetical protein [Caudoviricetes sp.]